MDMSQKSLLRSSRVSLPGRSITPSQEWLLLEPPTLQLKNNFSKTSFESFLFNISLQLFWQGKDPVLHLFSKEREVLVNHYRVIIRIFEQIKLMIIISDF
jgi:hypothetical protein